MQRSLAAADALGPRQCSGGLTIFPVAPEDAAMMPAPDARDDLATLTNRFEALAALLQQLTEENARLLSKNEQARNRVEAMIQRLKSMESTL